MLGGSMMMPGGADFDIPFSASLDGSSGVLTRDFSAGDRKQWTMVIWLWRSELNVRQIFWETNPGNPDEFQFNTDNTLTVQVAGGAGFLKTIGLFDNPNGFYCLQIVWDSLNVTPSERLKLYVNGVRQTSFSTEVYPSSGQDSATNSANSHRIGNYSTFYYNGYLSEFCFIDGLGVDPSYFGRVDTAVGEWKPKAYKGDYGVTGFHLDFHQDNGGTPSLGNDLGTDVSGNDNHWTMPASGVKRVTSTPTHFSAHWDSLIEGNSVSYSNGNNTIVCSSDERTLSSLPIPETGSFKVEITVDSSSSSAMVGVVNETFDLGAAASGGDRATGGTVYEYDGDVMENIYTNVVGSYTAFGASDVITILVDRDLAKVWFKLNDVSLNGDPALGTGGFNLYTSASNLLWFMCGTTAAGASAGFTAAFSENEWQYTDDARFKALNTENLPVRSPKTPTSPAAGSFTGNANADGKHVNLGQAPDQSGVSTINGNAITWGTHAIATATGFKVITSSTSYNSTGPNTYSVAVKAYVGGANVPEATAQMNPE